MLTPDELEQLGQVMDSKLERFSKQLDTKIESTKKETIQTIDAKIKATTNEIIQVIEQETKTIAGFFHTTWKKYDDHEERIETIEKELRLPKN